MDEDGSEGSVEDLNISGATKRCTRLLAQCAGVRLLMEREWAENRLADFNLWTSGIGAAATETDKISLDARLSGKPGLITVFTRLLQMLIGFLEDCLSLAGHLRGDELDEHSQWWARSHRDTHADNEPRSRSSRKRASSDRRTSRSLSPWSDQSSVGSALGERSGGRLAEAMIGVDSTMDQLNNVGFAIRRAGSQLRMLKADSRFDLSTHSNLDTFLRFWVMVNTRTGTPGAEVELQTLSPIQLRLIETNLIRRNRFLYAQRHSRRLLKSRQNHRREPRPTLSSIGAGGSLPVYNNEHVEPMTRRQGPLATDERSDVTQEPLADDSTATRLESATDILKQSFRARDSQITSTALRVRYPKPPKMRPGITLFKCPCCCQTLDLGLSLGGRWRRHLAEDVGPYSCILDDCSIPKTTFVTRQTWMNHMTGEEHPTERFWSCLVCADGFRHEDKSSLALHIKESHEQHVSPDQIPTLLDACLQTLSTSDFSCPLCSSKEAEDIRFSLDHIAEHLHSFALLSLPWAPDAAVVETDALQETSTKVVPWLGLEHDSRLSTTEPVQVAPNSTTDEASLYFMHEAYFAENESMHSNSSSASNDTYQDLEGFDTEGSLVFPEGDIKARDELSGDLFSVASDILRDSTLSRPRNRTEDMPIYPVRPFSPELYQCLAMLPKGFRLLALQGLMCTQLIERVAMDYEHAVVLVSRASTDLLESDPLRRKLTLLERLIWIAVFIFHLAAASPTLNEALDSIPIALFVETFMTCSQVMTDCSQAENECLLWCGCTLAWILNITGGEDSNFQVVLYTILSKFNMTAHEMNAIATKFFWKESLATLLSAMLKAHIGGNPQEAHHQSAGSGLPTPGDEHLDQISTPQTFKVHRRDPDTFARADTTIPAEREIRGSLEHTSVRTPMWLKKSIPEIASTFQDLERKERSRFADALQNPGTSPFRVHQSNLVASRNRYNNVQPWDSNRIRLAEPIGGSDYINASPIMLMSGSSTASSKIDSAVPSSINQLERRYIVTQGPMETTIVHFWQMVLQESSGTVGVIIMLTRLFDGMEYCSQYYPTDMQNPTMTFSAIELDAGKPYQSDLGPERVGAKPVGYQERESSRNPSNDPSNDPSDDQGFCTVTLLSSWYDQETRCEVRQLRVVIGQQSQSIIHYMYDGWPDGGKPEDEDRNALLRLMRVSRDMAGDSARIVHDSGGIGRSGTFMALDFLLEMLGLLQLSKNRPLDLEEDARDLVAETVDQLRNQRMMMVMNVMQLGFIYEVLRDEFVRKYDIDDDGVEDVSLPEEEDPVGEISRRMSETRNLDDEASNTARAASNPRSSQSKSIKKIQIASRSGYAEETALIDPASTWSKITLQKLTELLGDIEYTRPQVPHDHPHLRPGFIGTKTLPVRIMDSSWNYDEVFCIVAEADHPIVLRKYESPPQPEPTGGISFPFSEH